MPKDFFFYVQYVSGIKSVWREDVCVLLLQNNTHHFLYLENIYIYLNDTAVKIHTSTKKQKTHKASAFLVTFEA